MSKPNFFIIGASKAGTTSLWHLLRQHPDIFMCEPKEPKFFTPKEADSYTYKDGSKGWSWYENLFNDARDHSIIGDASTNYHRVSDFPQVPVLLGRYFPESKLLYSVRQPLDRMLSVYIQCLSTGYRMPRRFDEAVKSHSPFVEGCRYWQNLNAFRRYFSDDQIHVVLFEEFISRPAEVLEEIFQFLAVDPDDYRAEPEQKNPSKGKTMDHWLYDYMKRVPGYCSFEKALPWRMRKTWQDLMTVSVPPKPFWPLELKRWVLDEVGDDARRILHYAGKDPTFWFKDD